MDVPRVIEPPKLWRLKRLPDDMPDAHFYTNEGCRFSPNYFSYDGGNDATEYIVDPCATNKLELFVLLPGHPAYPGMGVKAKEALPEGTEIGYYTGVMTPNWFLEQDNNNAYVMVASPDPYKLVVNAKRVGNITRFINDPRGTGREANVKSGWVIKGRDPNKLYFILINAISDIAAGEELLLRYEDGNSSFWREMAKHHQRTRKVIDLTIEEVPVKRERQEAKDDIQIVSESKRPKQKDEDIQPKQIDNDRYTYEEWFRVLWCDIPERKLVELGKVEEYFPVTYTYEHPTKGKCRVRFTPLKIIEDGDWRYFASREHLNKHEIDYNSYNSFEKNHPAWDLLLQNGHKINKNGTIYSVPYSAIAFGASKWNDITKDHNLGD